ncbi:MAG: substrate-binding domain-containing protein [Oscillospiraceae bacterium]|nr:substrate-binding domain-containing protein [Oscillospiraceae bacterium]
MFILELLMISPIILIILGVIGYNLVAHNKLLHLGRVFMMLPIIGLIFFVEIILHLLFNFISSYADAINTMLWILGLLLIALFAFVMWKVIKKKAVYIPLIVCTAICVCITGVLIALDNKDNSIPTMRENEDLLSSYVPYVEDTKVAELDEESTLLITEDVPKMDGATAMYPVYSAFAKAVYPETLIGNEFEYDYLVNEHLMCNTTTEAYIRIAQGDADIIFAFAPSAEQVQFAKEKGAELVLTPVGKEAFVFFVNSRNPIDNLTLEQVQAIYSGEITRWNDLGVEGFGDIRAFQRDEGSGSQSTLISIMEGKELVEAPKENIVRAMGGIISQTADYKNYKNAIGFSFRFYSTEMAANDQIKILSIDGVAPTVENIENGTYPLTYDFYAVTRSDASENTLKLVEWILSEQGQELVEKTGYTPVK